MILTPKMIIVVIGTGLFWLLALMVALLFVAGLVRGDGGLTTIGLIGLILAFAVHWLFKHNEKKVQHWLKSDT